MPSIRNAGISKRLNSKDNFKITAKELDYAIKRQIAMFYGRLQFQKHLDRLFIAAIKATFSILFGFMAMYPLGYIFDHMQWVCFNSWTLSHGAFIVAWPSLSIAIYLVIGIFIKVLK